MNSRGKLAQLTGQFRFGFKNEQSTGFYIMSKFTLTDHLSEKKADFIFNFQKSRH